MQQWDEPVRIERPEFGTPLEMVRARCEEAPQHIAFRVDTPEGHRDLTLVDFLSHLDRVAAALLRHGGLRPGSWTRWWLITLRL